VVKFALKQRGDGQNADRKQILVDALSAQMAETSRSQQCTKRTAARLAIASVIRANLVKPGEFLPSEKELTTILGVSLGTVQAALRQLQDMGSIVRRRGDGTRVSALEPHGDSIWHFRFASKHDGSPLRIIDQDVWVDQISTNGVWSEYIGWNAQYVRIRRLLTMQNGALAGAEMFLNCATAEGIDQIEVAELQFTNIRPYLEEKFGLITKGTTHMVKTVDLDEETAAHFGLGSTGPHYEIHAKAFSLNQSPVYFQRIYIATADCALIF
jgi:GntR family transcriptional regulator